MTVPLKTPPSSVIPLIKPWIETAELEAVRGPLSSGWVTQGPEVEAFEEEFAEVVGADHACAVSTDGSIECWGDNSMGQCNAADSTFTQVAAGGWHSCAVTTADAIACWGNNSAGQCTVPE